MDDFEDGAFFDPLRGRDEEVRVPNCWTPEHVGLRLVEAFQTLNALPEKQGGSSAWPPYPYEQEDIEAQREQREKEAATRRGRGDGPRQRIAPSMQSITQMQRAFDWLWILDHQSPGSARRVVHWASSESQSFNPVGRVRLELKDARMGLSLIASHLDIRREPVF
ncbi:MAG: hypothetical protein JWM36_3196 [Hyphomicrobiales bacterium]|nr:hypothetical protein [Hyphomicrobiales bacterium]